MNRIKLLFLLLLCFTCLFSCKNIKQDVDNIIVQMSVSQQSGDEYHAHGYPIYMRVSITGSQPSTSLYVHIFQRINGDQYYYQSSSSVTINTSIDLPVYLGSLSGINQNYEVYAIVNDDKSYTKDRDNIYRVNSLPQYQKAAVLVYRER